MLSNGAQFEFGAVCVYGCCACRRCTRVAAEERERGCLLRLLQQGQSIRISAGQTAVDNSESLQRTRVPSVRHDIDSGEHLRTGQSIELTAMN